MSTSRTQRRVDDVGGRLLAAWREESVRIALWASAAVHLVIGLSPYTRGMLPRFALEDLALSIGVVHGVTAGLPGRRAWGAPLLLGATFIEMVAVGVIAGWQPEFSLLALFVCVYGGLLLPRRFGWAPPAAVFVFFVGLSLLGPSRWLVAVPSPASESSWHRVAFSYAIITGVLAHVTQRTLRLLLEAHGSASAALGEATAERKRLELVRSTIREAEREMSRASEGESASSLAARLYTQVDGLLATVRQTLVELGEPRDTARVRALATGLMAATEGTAGAIRQILGSPRSPTAGEASPHDEQEEVSDVELTALPRTLGSPAEWRHAAVGRALGLATLVYGAAVLGLLFSARATSLRDVVFESLAFVASLLGFYFSRLPTSLRVGLFLAALSLPNASIVLVRSYMAPTSVLALAAACLCAAVYSSRWATGGLLLGTTAVFLFGARGPLQGQWQDAVVTPGNMNNWWRLSIVFPLACWALSRVILDLLDSVARSLSELNEALRLLSRARRALEQSADQLSTMSREREKSPRSDEDVRSVRRGAHDLGNSLAVLLGWSEQLLRVAHDEREVAYATSVLRETRDEIESGLRSFEALRPAEPASLLGIA